MSVRNETPGVEYGPVDQDFKEELDAQFETGDVDYEACHETAPTCTSCCEGSMSACVE